MKKFSFLIDKYRLLFYTILAGILVFVVSCDDNSRSLGTFRISVATVIPEGIHTYSLQLDNGKRLWPAASDVMYNPTDNQRVFINYTILSEKLGEYDHYVKVNDIWDILTKQTVELTNENDNKIGNDPLKINDIWVGGDYLNVSFMFNYSGERPHFINLVENNGLEFRHNSYGSTNTNLYEGFVCFDLKPFRTNEADSVELSIKVLEWADGPNSETKEIIYDVIYKYNQPTLQARVEMPIPVISSSEYY